MRIVILAGGRIKERGIREAIDDYIGRIRRYVPLDEIELKERSAADLQAAALRRIPQGSHIVALDAGGRTHSSEGFSRWLDRLGSRGKGTIVFILGAADGIPAGLLAVASERLSLSTLTLPHRLARLILMEQIYRAMTLLRGEPYSR